jgi:hypothetical protein
MGKRIIRLGPVENIFHHMCGLGFGNYDLFKAWIEEGAPYGQF